MFCCYFLFGTKFEASPPIRAAAAVGALCCSVCFQPIFADNESERKWRQQQKARKPQKRRGERRMDRVICGGSEGGGIKTAQTKHGKANDNSLNKHK